MKFRCSTHLTYSIGTRYPTWSPSEESDCTVLVQPTIAATNMNYPYHSSKYIQISLHPFYMHVFRVFLLQVQQRLVILHQPEQVTPGVFHTLTLSRHWLGSAPRKPRRDHSHQFNLWHFLPGTFPRAHRPGDVSHTRECYEYQCRFFLKSWVKL